MHTEDIFTTVYIGRVLNEIHFLLPILILQGQLGSTQNKGLIPCVLLVLKEMLPTYHKWRYNSYGVRERIGKSFFSSRLENDGKT